MNYKRQFNTWDSFMEKAPIPLQELKRIYTEETVYPIKEHVFRAFRLTDIDKLKVVILGQDPYPNAYRGEPSACGVAFATQNGYKNPSVRIIIDEINRSIPFAVTQKPDDLLLWCGQGVLMLNTALTVQEGKANSHAKMWKAFTEYVIIKLSKERPDLVWLLMGKQAQKYQELFFGGTAVKTAHPAAEVYAKGNAGFTGSDCFKKVNDALWKMNKEKITW